VCSTTQFSPSHRVSIVGQLCVNCDVDARASTDSHAHGHGRPSAGRAWPRPGASGTAEPRFAKSDDERELRERVRQDFRSPHRVLIVRDV
jgi:hypothetical protein